MCDEILPYFLADVLRQTVQQELAMAVLHNPQAVQNCLLLHRALFPVDMGGIDDLQVAITVQRYVVQSHRAPAGYSAKKKKKEEKKICFIFNEKKSHSQGLEFPLLWWGEKRE